MSIRQKRENVPYFMKPAADQLSFDDRPECMPEHDSKRVNIHAENSELHALTNKVHNIDCIELMASMPTDSVNMVFADPPFNLDKKYSSYKDHLPFRKYISWTEQWIEQACRVLRPDGSIFVYNIPRLLVHTASILNEIAEFRHWIAWDSNGKPLGKTLQPSHYGILFYSKTRNSKFYDVRAPHKTCRICKGYIKDYGGKEHLRHRFGYQISDVWSDIHRVRHASKRIDDHPCQLPVHLIERMILMTTDENDIVVDPFCGGGSAAVATKQMGRRYIGAEIDRGYWLASGKKLNEAKPVKHEGIYCSVHLKKLFRYVI